MIDMYNRELLDNQVSRAALHLHPALAPVKAAVLPLSKKLSEQAQEVFAKCSRSFLCEFDDAGSIGKRCRQHEIGTPFCVAYDFDSLQDGCMTIGARDTLER